MHSWCRPVEAAVGALSNSGLRFVLAAAVIGVVVACGSSGEDIEGEVTIHGSSTVYPLSEAIAEGFREVDSDVKVTIGIAGTGGGFQRLCRGEIAVQDASRPITEQESAACRRNGVDYIELPIAYDAVSIVVHPSNGWVTCITTEELKRMWRPSSELVVTKWDDVNDDWPDLDLRLYGPGFESGTFDYFTELILGEVGRSRRDYIDSTDHGLLVEAVSLQTNALSYVGYAYYRDNALVINSQVRALAVDDGDGCVEPSAASVEDRSYPLSRPLFIYVRSDAAARPEVDAFIDYYLRNVAEVSTDVGYISLPDRIYDLVRSRWHERKTGSVFAGAEAGSSLEQLLRE
jgi:phosphate transport system substrate-binding protein